MDHVKARLAWDASFYGSKGFCVTDFKGLLFHAPAAPPYRRDPACSCPPAGLHPTEACLWSFCPAGSALSPGFDQPWTQDQNKHENSNAPITWPQRRRRRRSRSSCPPEDPEKSSDQNRKGECLQMFYNHPKMLFSEFNNTEFKTSYKNLLFLVYFSPRFDTRNKRSPKSMPPPKEILSVSMTTPLFVLYCEILLNQHLNKCIPSAGFIFLRLFSCIEKGFASIQISG